MVKNQLKLYDILFTFKLILNANQHNTVIHFVVLSVFNSVGLEKGVKEGMKTDATTKCQIR